MVSCTDRFILGIQILLPTPPPSIFPNCLSYIIDTIQDSNIINGWEYKEDKSWSQWNCVTLSKLF